MLQSALFFYTYHWLGVVFPFWQVDSQWPVEKHLKQTSYSCGWFLGGLFSVLGVDELLLLLLLIDRKNGKLLHPGKASWAGDDHCLGWCFRVPYGWTLLDCWELRFQCCKFSFHRLCSLQFCYTYIRLLFSIAQEMGQQCGCVLTRFQVFIQFRNSV